MIMWCWGEYVHMNTVEAQRGPRILWTGAGAGAGVMRSASAGNRTLILLRKSGMYTWPLSLSSSPGWRYSKDCAFLFDYHIIGMTDPKKTGFSQDFNTGRREAESLDQWGDMTLFSWEEPRTSVDPRQEKMGGAIP